MDPASSPFFEDRRGSGALYRPPPPTTTATTTTATTTTTAPETAAPNGAAAPGTDAAAMELSEAAADAGQTDAKAHPPTSATADIGVTATGPLAVGSAVPDVALAVPDVGVVSSTTPDLDAALVKPDLSSGPSALPDLTAPSTAMPDVSVVASVLASAVMSAPASEDEDGMAGRSRSSSGSSSSSSDWMSDLAPGERLEVLRKAYEAAIESDDETGVTSAAGPPRSRNEAAELPPVVVRTDVLPETAMIAPLGRISGIVETFVLVQSHSGVAPLDASSLLCLGSRRVLGQVFDVMGRVTDPVYSVRFNTASEIDRALFAVGTPVFSVLSEAVPVFMDRARQKGTDASNLYDEELPEEEQEFSDDEKEAAHKREDKHRHGRRSKGQRMAVDTPTAHAAAHGSAPPTAAGPRVIPPMPAYPMHRPPSSAAPYGAAPPSSQPALNWAPPQHQQQHQQQQQQQQQQAYSWTRPPAPSYPSQPQPQPQPLPQQFYAQPAPGSMYDPPVLPRLPLLGIPAMPRPATPGDPRAYRPPPM